MAKLSPYTHSLRSALQTSLCIQSFPSPQVERHYKPEVETQENPEVLLPPVCIAKSSNERCLIEGSLNSVRISFKLGLAARSDRALVEKYTRFLMQRADCLTILRRVPVEGYDISFLVTDQHLLVIEADSLIDFFCNFIEEVDNEMNHLMLAVKARARAVAEELTKALVA